MNKLKYFKGADLYDIYNEINLWLEIEKVEIIDIGVLYNPRDKTNPAEALVLYEPE